jgi:hypothetical protein
MQHGKACDRTYGGMCDTDKGPLEGAGAVALRNSQLLAAGAAHLS